MKTFVLIIFSLCIVTVMIAGFYFLQLEYNHNYSDDKAMMGLFIVIDMLMIAAGCGLIVWAAHLMDLFENKFAKGLQKA